MSINPITFDLLFLWPTLIHFQGKSSFTLISLLFLSLACLPPLVFRSLPHAVLSKMVGIDSLAHGAAFVSFFSDWYLSSWRRLFILIVQFSSNKACKRSADPFMSN